VNQRETLSKGLFTWLVTRHLETAYLEVFLPSNPNTAEEHWGMNFVYLDPTDNGANQKSSNTYSYKETNIKMLKEIAAQLKTLPEGSMYRIVFSLKDGAPEVEGWQSTELRSVTDLEKRDLGNIIGSPKIGAGMFVQGRF
jgi:hypothetical protein